MNMSDTSNRVEMVEMVEKIFGHLLGSVLWRFRNQVGFTRWVWDAFWGDLGAC